MKQKIKQNVQGWTSLDIIINKTIFKWSNKIQGWIPLNIINKKYSLMKQQKLKVEQH